MGDQLSFQETGEGFCTTGSFSYFTSIPKLDFRSGQIPGAVGAVGNTHQNHVGQVVAGVIAIHCRQCTQLCAAVQ